MLKDVLEERREDLLEVELGRSRRYEEEEVIEEKDRADGEENTLIQSEGQKEKEGSGCEKEDQRILQR